MSGGEAQALSDPMQWAEHEQELDIDTVPPEIWPLVSLNTAVGVILLSS